MAPLVFASSAFVPLSSQPGWLQVFSAHQPVTLTVRARSRSPEPLDIVLPSLAGFTIVGSRDFTEVSVGGSGGPVRTTSRSLELRADRAGALVIGAVTVRQGARAVRTDPVTIMVDSVAGSPNELGPIARARLDLLGMRLEEATAEQREYARSWR